ncbi:hypothetical protein [Croceitalea dokdonensis]|nr:hypothetical protein [Croceitalea dokdonensis]
MGDVIRRNPKFQPLDVILVDDGLLETFEDFQGATFFAPVDSIQYRKANQKFRVLESSEKNDHRWILA